MSYYDSNAIYTSLVGNRNYCWTVGNAWILVYGDQDATPKVIVFAHSHSWQNDNRVPAVMAALSRRTGLPTLQIAFDDNAPVITQVTRHLDAGVTQVLDSEQLKALFAEYGVPVNNRSFSKAINDKESSVYHKWQRAMLGNITVSDIDLIRIQNQQMQCIMELKRSIIDIQRWRPFDEDKANFRLLHNFCKRAQLDFVIAYNVRHKKPTLFDDPSQIKLFYYDANFNIKQEKIVLLSDFLSLNY